MLKVLQRKAPTQERLVPVASRTCKLAEGNWPPRDVSWRCPSYIVFMGVAKSLVRFVPRRAAGRPLAMLNVIGYSPPDLPYRVGPG
jgi:hypothetical protein